MTAAPAISKKQYLLGGGFVLLAGAGLYGLLPRLHGFGASWQALRSASPGLVGLAAALSLLATACSAVLYALISLRPLRVGVTWLIQLSGLFINRILPAGIGGLGLNYLYLRGRQHTVVQATTIVALNNLLGILGHALLAVVLVSWYLLVGNTLSVRLPAWQLLSTAGVAVLVLLVAVLALPGPSWLVAWRRGAGRQLRDLASHYQKHPWRFSIALIVSCFLTLCNVASLWVCCRALGVSIDFVTIFLLFTFGVAAGTATPTPGGLGGIEAALAAGLVSQHATWSTALAVTLLYRLVSFWIGLPIGAVAFSVVQSKHWLRAS